MAYEKITFENGQVLTAQQLNQMQTNTENALNEKASLSGARFTSTSTSDESYISAGEIRLVDENGDIGVGLSSGNGNPQIDVGDLGDAHTFITPTYSKFLGEVVVDGSISINTHDGPDVMLAPNATSAQCQGYIYAGSISVDEIGLGGHGDIPVVVDFPEDTTLLSTDSIVTKGYVDQQVTNLKAELGLLDVSITVPQELRSYMRFDLDTMTEEKVEERVDYVETNNYDINDVSRLLDLLSGTTEITQYDITRYHIDPEDFSITDVTRMLDILSGK